MTYLATFQDYEYSYFWDLKLREVQEIYFKMKNKYEHSFTESEKESFIATTLKTLQCNEHWNNADVLLVPETSNSVLLAMCKVSGKETVIIYKNSKEEIKLQLDKQSLMKTEREKLYKALDDMSQVKMANIAGNQRKRFVSILFKQVVLPEAKKHKNCVFFDDSIFSGYTFLAAQEAIKDMKHQNIILFNKNF